MDNIPLSTLTLVTFDRNNPYHIAFLKELVNDKSILQWFQGISAILLHHYGDTLFNNGYFINKEDTLIGYVHIGAFNVQDKCVYLRYATSSSARGKGYYYPRVQNIYLIITLK